MFPQTNIIHATVQYGYDPDNNDRLEVHDAASPI